MFWQPQCFILGGQNRGHEDRDQQHMWGVINKQNDVHGKEETYTEWKKRTVKGRNIHGREEMYTEWKKRTWKGRKYAPKGKQNVHGKGEGYIKRKKRTQKGKRAYTEREREVYVPREMN